MVTPFSQLPPIAYCASPAVWPGPPATFSYSSLKEAEGCPRQWSLRRGQYPLVWKRAGFPGRPHPRMVAGSVIHRAIEVVVGLLIPDGCESFQDPRAVAVLKKAGGWTQILRRCVDDVLSREAANPRIPGGFEAFKAAVIGEVPDLRLRVQAVVSRLKLLSINGSASRFFLEGRGGNVPRPLGPGTYNEVKMEAPALGFVGTADMVTVGSDNDGCEIDDFKTGISRDEHATQLQLYSLLWARDILRNPAGRRVIRLRVRYESGDIDVPVLSDDEMNALEGELRQRIAAASASLTLNPPEARPGREICGFCDVRHLCDKYWNQELQHQLGQDQPNSFSIDLQVRLRAARGGMMWDAIVEVGRGFQPGDAILLRATQANDLLDHALAANHSARVLGATASSPIDGNANTSGPRIVNIYPRSETFVVRRADALSD